ncbi:MAG: hypothetical protein ABSH45_18680 [Bryobacteraceae bacterium]
MTSRGLPPRWEVRRDLSAPTQPYVLAHLSNAAGTDRSPLAIFDSLSLRDADVSVRIKAVGGREDETGGVVWRYRDPGNYYLALANAQRHNVAIFRVQDGRRVELRVPVPHDIEPNAWNILKVAVRGSRFTIPSPTSTTFGFIPSKTGEPPEINQEMHLIPQRYPDEALTLSSIGFGRSVRIAGQYPAHGISTIR